MKGLLLSREYYDQLGAPMLRREFDGLVDRIAVGFAGPGSECFGFDDEISRDHDWGPAFCMWLTADDYKNYGRDLQKAYEGLGYQKGSFPNAERSATSILSLPMHPALTKIQVQQVADACREVLTTSPSG